MKKKELEPDLISIIVLVYNTQKYVTKCLNSILNQTYQNIEVIVIDDGSTDLSNSLIKRKMKRDSRITLIEHENKGTYLSRLEGYKKARGKYLMYVDSDDYILKDTIEIMYNNLKEYNTENLDMRLEKIMQEKNTISSILKIIAWVLIVLGFILGFILGKNEYDDIEFSSLMTIWLTYGGISLGIFALAEIIQILHDIRFSIWDSKKKS